MNLSSLLQFRDEWARFKARHPKFSPFLKAAYTRAAARGQRHFPEGNRPGRNRGGI